MTVRRCGPHPLMEWGGGGQTPPKRAASIDLSVILNNISIDTHGS